jgi:hypothetical protein
VEAAESTLSLNPTSGKYGKNLDDLEGLFDK